MTWYCCYKHFVSKIAVVLNLIIKFTFFPCKLFLTSWTKKWWTKFLIEQVEFILFSGSQLSNRILYSWISSRTYENSDSKSFVTLPSRKRLLSVLSSQKKKMKRLSLDAETAKFCMAGAIRFKFSGKVITRIARRKVTSFSPKPVFFPLRFLRLHSLLLFLSSSPFTSPSLFFVISLRSPSKCLNARWALKHRAHFSQCYGGWYPCGENKMLAYFRLIAPHS